MEENLKLPNRGETQIAFEILLCIVINVVSLVGNTMVTLSVYRNDRLRTPTNLYIIALAVSDLACAAIEMPLTTGTLIAGRWVYGDAVCQLVAFVDVFVTYVSPATIALTALNRYVRIVKADHFNIVFSPRRSKIFLFVTWLSLVCYIVIARLTRWQVFVFTPGYATCMIGHLSEARKIVHYSILVSLFFVVPLVVSCFSYYEVFKVIRYHNLAITPQLQTSLRRAKIALHEIKLSKSLFIVVASFFLCWVPFWFILIFERFSLTPVSRNIQILATLFLFLSSTINPFIYAGSNRAFRKEFKKLLPACGHNRSNMVAPFSMHFELTGRK